VEDRGGGYYSGNTVNFGPIPTVIPLIQLPSHSLDTMHRHRRLFVNNNTSQSRQIVFSIKNEPVTMTTKSIYSIVFVFSLYCETLNFGSLNFRNSNYCIILVSLIFAFLVAGLNNTQK